MSFLPTVKRSDVRDPLVAARYERHFGPDRDPAVEPGTAGGTKGDFWTVLAHSPATYALMEESIALMLKADVTSPVLKELGIVRASWNIGSQFTFSQHTKLLRNQGVSADKADAVRFWQQSDLFDPLERLVLAYADDISLAHGRVPDERMHALMEELTSEQIVELTYTIGLWVLHSSACKAMRLEWDDRDDPIVEVPSPQDAPTTSPGLA